MVDTVPLYAFFSITAMLIKLGLLSFSRTWLSLKNRWFFGLFIGLLGINIFELCCILYVTPNQLALSFLKAFHLSCLFAASMLLGLILRIQGKASSSATGVIVFLLLASSTAVILPGAGIAGVQSLGHSITRVAGPFYWVFQLTFLFFLAAAVSLLAREVWVGEPHGVRRRSKALLMAAAPFFLGGPSVVVLMQLGFQVNAVATASFTIILFLLAFIITESEVVSVSAEPKEDRLSRLLSLWPATSEFKLTAHVRKAICEREKTGFQAGMETFEKAIISDILRSCNGNKSIAAKQLGISRTTLRRKLEALGLKHGP